MNEAGNTHRCSLVQCRTTGIATHPNSNLRTELLDDILRHTLALPNLIEHLHVLQQVLTVETLNRQAFDFVACGWHALHLHTSQRSYKQYFGIRVHCLDGIGNRHGREDVSTRAATTDYYS